MASSLRPAAVGDPSADEDRNDGASRRRHAAGADPQKREQILAGARRVFMEQGYDAASMNDICRAAGVSKGTIYVYFADKEELFICLIEEERERAFLGADQFLEEDRPVEEKLRVYGERIARAICSEDVIRAQRIVAAIAERLPGVGARFFDSGAGRVHGGLRRLFQRETEAGRLAVADPSLAAWQFLELASAGLWRQRLFGKAVEPPSSAEIASRVESAVAMMLAAYRPDARR